MKTHIQPLPPHQKNTSKACDFQWYLLLGVSMQCYILAVATKQIHVSHNCIINYSSSLYRENEIFF